MRGNHFGEICVLHPVYITGQVIEEAYEVPGIFDRVSESMDKMKSINLSRDGQYLFDRAALTVKYDDEERSPVTPEQLIFPRWWEGKNNDFGPLIREVQENIIKGRLPSRNAAGKKTEPDLSLVLMVISG